MVRLFAVLRERAGKECLPLDGLPPGASVAALMQELRERHPELGSLEGVRGVLENRYVEDSTPLTEGQELCLLPPVSGGDGVPELDGLGEDESEALRRGIFELHSDPLDPESARRRVSHPTCGAAVVFTGTTRTRNRDRDVQHLDYEAFREMAGVEMGRIYERCCELHGPAGTSSPGEEGSGAELELRMLTLHRIGRVGIGDPSVVVAVASPHRDAAFLACRYLIDELKGSVPLWKKESYGDGQHWIGDRS